MAVDQWDFTGSSNLSSGEYDDQARVMQITFQNDRTYRWERIDPVMWDRLKSSPSAGQFLRASFGIGSEV